MKDNFSGQSSTYAQFRPVYPQPLYASLMGLVKLKHTAWDCGCGNGQVAGVLSDYFTRVIASDISHNQIRYAVQKPNIDYRVLPAENTDIADASVDLITVAQAMHWFNLPEFFNEVRRVGRPGSVLAAWCYSLLEVNADIDSIIWKLYNDTLGDAYWDPERKLVEDHYQSIPFPFEEIVLPEFSIETSWDLLQLTGFLNSWSAVQHYISKNKINPVTVFYEDLKAAWGDSHKLKVYFPVYARVGRIN